QSGNLHNLELPFRRRDGQHFIGLISAQPVQLDDIPAMVVVVRDISQLKEAEHQLQVSEEKFAKAFHASPDGLLITRLSDGMLIEPNKGFSRITGRSTAAVVGKRSTLDLGIWADPADREHMIELIRQQGMVHDYSAQIRTSDGRLRLCELSAQPIQVGGEYCMPTTARDITERQH